MKRISVSHYLFIALAAGLMGVSANAQDTIVKKVPPRPTVAIDGKTLFNQYCAVCHGADAKGGGPAADSLKQRPTDLTQISRKNNDKFPEEKILAELKGSGSITAHGSADMPIWGPIFGRMSSNLNQSQDRMHGLLNYLEQIQSK
jgi:mono/diheme cytochrome c family protein